MTDRIFHCRATGLTLAQFSEAGDARAGKVLSRGENFTVTEAEYELSKDRLGRSWLDMTPDEQVKRWGMQKFGTGPAPSDMAFGSDDEGYQYRQGTRAREEAQLISHPKERAAALAEVERKYGSALHPVAQGPQHIPGR
ncbi:hypothetical protein ACTJKK_03155 [Microbacterium sp. 22179]|uniref:hypothetical protein n=1 Tax=Microbacterium sp. 22179 TaxID=3453886 RepID=UPI003F854FB6